MKVPKLSSRRSAAPAGVSGPVRVGRSAASVAARLRPGEIAVIDHTDLDRAGAHALVSAGAAAVLNASSSISGRYPNLGPELLATAGVPLLDVAAGGAGGTSLTSRLRDGQRVRLADAEVYLAGESTLLARGRLLDADTVSTSMTAARTGLAAQLDAFTGNVVEVVKAEHGLLLEGAGLPRLPVSMAGRSVVVLSPGFGLERDLRLLRRFLRDHSPVLLAVDSAGDALTPFGLVPDVVISDLTPGSISDAALARAKGIVVHERPGHRSAGVDRLESLGLSGAVVTSGCTTADVGCLLAREHSAALVVTAGVDAGLDQLVDQGQSTSASALATRLAMGSIVVDAHAVGMLAQRRRTWPALACFVLALGAVLLAIAVTPIGHHWVMTGWGHVRSWTPSDVGRQASRLARHAQDLWSWVRSRL